MIDKLKPCPFCGGDARVYKTSTHYSAESWGDNWKVACNECNMGSMHEYSTEVYRNKHGEVTIEHDGKKEAIEAWNRRV